ncbi:hypothetical protein PanWU01x14_224590, partial [Parasponia andersonii]
MEETQQNWVLQCQTSTTVPKVPKNSCCGATPWCRSVVASMPWHRSANCIVP